MSGCALVKTWRVFVERTVARNHLSMTNRALFSVASRDMKLALDHAAIMAGMLFGSPILVLATVPNSANISPLDCIGRTLLGREYLFRPALDHRNATIQDAFRFAQLRNTTMQVSGKLLARNSYVRLRR